MGTAGPSMASQATGAVSAGKGTGDSLAGCARFSISTFVGRDFLQLHNGWGNYKGGFTLIGAGGQHTEAALSDIRQTVEIWLDAWTLSYGEPMEAKIAEFEAAGDPLNPWEAEGQVYIANKLYFGTDFNGRLSSSNPAKTRPDGEMEAVYWATSGGTYARYGSFIEMLQGDLNKLREELRQ